LSTMTNNIEEKLREWCPNLDTSNFISQLSTEVDDDTLTRISSYYIFSFNDEEAAAIQKETERRFDIKNSTDIYKSTRITNSSHISASDNIQDSNYIFKSFDITDSSFVYKSDNICRSIEVWDSYAIHDSRYVFSSNHVRNSKAIANCANIKDGLNLQETYRADNAKFCYLSSDLIDCSFCTQSYDLTSAMFCTEVSNLDFAIFNQKVSSQEYETIHEDLEFRLLMENAPSFYTIKRQMLSTPEARYQLNYEPGAIFSGLSKNFFGWIGTLPGYSEELFLKIFFPSKI